MAPKLSKLNEQQLPQSSDSSKAQQSSCQITFQSLKIANSLRINSHLILHQVMSIICLDQTNWEHRGRTQRQEQPVFIPNYEHVGLITYNFLRRRKKKKKKIFEKFFQEEILFWTGHFLLLSAAPHNIYIIKITRLLLLYYVAAASYPLWCIRTISPIKKCTHTHTSRGRKKNIVKDV